MSSAVLDRVLAIPDYDDVPQMGLSRSGLASLVERGGITKDGTKAKASVLERAGIKGDRKLGEVKPNIKFEELNPSIAAKASKTKSATKFKENLRSQFKDRADAIKAKPEKFNKNFLARQMSDAIDNEKARIVEERTVAIRRGNQKLLRVGSKKPISGYAKLDNTSGVKRNQDGTINNTLRRKKRTMTDRDISRNAGITAARLEAQGQLNLFNQPKQSAAIAPDTAKKVKRANSNSPKVVKGKSYTSTSGNQFQRIEIDGKTYDIKTRDGRKGSTMSYAEAKAKALAQHAKK